MMEYLEMWEKYIAENYNPHTMTCDQLNELYKISDILKDMAEYIQIKEQVHNMPKR